MYCILKTLLIGLVVALVNANPTKKIDGLAKALEQRSSKDPPPFNPDPDADYHGPERPAPKDSQSEYWNCIVKFVCGVTEIHNTSHPKRERNEMRAN